jgi:hypothetical protein
MTERVKMKQRVPRLRLALGAVAVIAFAFGGAAIWLWRVGRLDVLEMSTQLILCLVVGIAAAGTALTYTPGPIPDTGGLAGEPAEKSLNWKLVSNVVAGLVWTGYGTAQAAHAFGDGDRMTGYGYAALVLLWLYVSPATLMGWAPQGKKLRDDPDRELNHAFRAQATASGFWALLAGGAAAFLISFSSPSVLPYLLPFILWLGGSVACIHFVWLHRQADRDLGDDG